MVCLAVYEHIAIPIKHLKRRFQRVYSFFINVMFLVALTQNIYMPEPKKIIFVMKYYGEHSNIILIDLVAIVLEGIHILEGSVAAFIVLRADIMSILRIGKLCRC